jgi:hypothetical protein
MPQNFIESSREQGFLLPPDVRDWLPADHLAWFVIDAVAQMDLSAFYAAYRADGHGRAAYEPSTMVTLILYAFATRVRLSRAIERHCREDVAYRGPVRPVGRTHSRDNAAVCPARRDCRSRGIAVTPSRVAARSHSRGRSRGERRVRDQSACSLRVSTASSRDYVWSPTR